MSLFVGRDTLLDLRLFIIWSWACVFIFIRQANNMTVLNLVVTTLTIYITVVVLTSAVSLFIYCLQLVDIFTIRYTNKETVRNNITGLNFIHFVNFKFCLFLSPFIMCSVNIIFRLLTLTCPLKNFSDNSRVSIILSLCMVIYWI